MRGVRFGLAMLLACSLALPGCAAPWRRSEAVSSRATIEAEGTDREGNSLPADPLPPRLERVLSRVYEPQASRVSQVATTRSHSWAQDYVLGRVRAVGMEPRDSLAFGPWEAAWEPYATEARSDGSLTEWDVHYYVTHNWSTYGQAILAMQPGDTVTVNGQAITIEGIFDYPKDSILDEVLILTGSEALSFQTCVPDSTYNRIAFGR